MTSENEIAVEPPTVRMENRRRHYPASVHRDLLGNGKRF